MTIELWVLLGLALLLFAAIFVQQITMDKVYGTQYALSNRDGPARLSPDVERLGRLVRNHVEGLAVFTPLVLVATLTQTSNAFTQVAALVILAARILHFVFYALGVTPLRSVVWGIGFLLATPAFIFGLFRGIGLPF